MRSPRIKAPISEPAAYHCITRTVDGAFLFEDCDKEMLRKQLWQAAGFSGVQILTYCLLSNHFHVLVRVPAQEPISDGELVRRYRLLYPRGTRFNTQDEAGAITLPSSDHIEHVLAAGGADAERLRTSLNKRMGDVSEFMKTLKQRFSVWYNHTHKRFGTLWAERFKSVLVEPGAHTLATIAAYIDLNPVRAGLVHDPKDYRFCGYGEALGHGNMQIQEGLNTVLESQDWQVTAKEYRMILFGKGSELQSDGSAAGTIPWENAREVLNKGGHLPTSTVLRCRVRYFTDGAVLGSSAFVSAALLRYQNATSRRKRQKGPVILKGSDWKDLAVLRALRRNVFG